MTKSFLVLLIVLVLSVGCATPPAGPGTRGIYAPGTVYPSPR